MVVVIKLVMMEVIEGGDNFKHVTYCKGEV